MEKKQYVLEGLCCEHCAAKIQEDIRLINGVKSAKVEGGALSVEFDADPEALGREIARIAVSHDEDIVVKEA